MENRRGAKHGDTASLRAPRRAGRADPEENRGFEESPCRGERARRRHAGARGPDRQSGFFLGFVEDFLEDEALWVEALGPIRDMREATAGVSGLRYTAGLRVSFWA